MGLWKKLTGREDESADAFGHAGEGAGAHVETPLVSFQSAPMETTWSSVTVNGRPGRAPGAVMEALQAAGAHVDPNAATSVPPPSGTAAEPGDPMEK